MKIYDTKRLIFSFYLSECSLSNSVNKLHLKLLSRYINNFDEIIFCIIPESGLDSFFIYELEKAVIEFTHKNIEFKIVENTNYRESLVYKTEIVDKMRDLDGLTLFGHNKGISYSDVTEDTFKWIVALYYFNLEVELPNNDMNGMCFYGALKSTNIYLEDYTPNSAVVLPKYNWFYNGTFFWGKYQEVFNLLKNIGREIPEMCSRWFDEMFPGNVLEEYWGSCYGECCASKNMITGDNIDSFLYQTYKGEEWVFYNFLDFYNFIMGDGDIR